MLTARRAGEDGVLTFSLPLSGDTLMPWVNPLTAMGPVGDALFRAVVSGPVHGTVSLVMGVSNQVVPPQHKQGLQDVIKAA